MIHCILDSRILFHQQMVVRRTQWLLDLSFKDPGKKEWAYRRWVGIKQGVTKAGTFLANFEIAMMQSGIPKMDVNVILPQLREAVQKEIQAGLIRYPKKPTTFEGMKEVIIELDDQERQVRALDHPKAPQL